MHRLYATLFLLGAVAACGGVDARIKENDALFATYPPDVQATIRSGQIAKGFDGNQVYMALGKPDLKEAGGASETWTYTERVRRTLTVKKDVHKYRAEQLEHEARVARGEYSVEPSLEEHITQHRTQVVHVVHFENGRVIGWEQPVDTYLDDWS